MHVQVYMIYIMEGIDMWNIIEEKNYIIYKNEICSLKIYYREEHYNIYIDYKGYNILMPMGMWGFEDEIQDRGIEYEIGGEKGKFKTFFYIIKKQDLKLFCDLIYFFLSEHNMDSTLNDFFKMEI